MCNRLDKVRFVLVEPSHPGNVGAVARAMKTMGLSQLYLVNPKKQPHNIEAQKRAAGADDVLQQAVVVKDVASAVKDCHLVFATSAREREVNWPICSPRQAAKNMLTYLQENTFDNNIAILFGRESSGLTNQELDYCRWQIVIDANQEYSSLNLASAVQIITYEIRLALFWGGVFQSSNDELSAIEKRQLKANQGQVLGFLEHLAITLNQLDFIKSGSSTMLQRKLSRLFNKSELTIEEVQILRGILTAVQDQLK